jgi:hypothetical protein
VQILRVIDSLQLTAKHSVATPVNWKHGEDVVVVPTLTDEQAKEKVPPPPPTLNATFWSSWLLSSVDFCRGQTYGHATLSFPPSA